MELKNKLTVIIVVYDEAAVIGNVVRDFYEKIIKKIPGTEFIVSEDGSRDGTKEILQRINKEIPFTLISEETRKGYTKAFKDALRLAKTELIFFSDSDGQHEPEDIFKLLNGVGNYDIVSGYKYPRRDPVYRIILSKGYNWLIYLLFGIKLKDIDSGFKLIRKEVIDNILSDVTGFKYCVMSEFVLKAYLSGYKIKEIPVRHYPRAVGMSSIFSPAKLPAIIIQLINNLFEMRFNYLRMK